ncbi:unnamed protein product [Macrosiphum euphorbiae]|uniref:Uncharacterized protein n=1 Tax=Macrosiphum euphorbiae TaxID=13131 RepID=A0AAV0Y5P9_9HEMI|nr:unnamed protein product [Macrosiphum euphorbiae]
MVMSDMDLDNSFSVGVELEETEETLGGGAGGSGRPLEDIEPRGKAKRRKVVDSDEEDVSERTSVGMSSFPEKARLSGREMDAALLKEKEKRKISAAFHRQILEFRGRYEVLLDEALRQNTVLLGRVEEARRIHSCVGLVREVVEEDVTVTGKPSKAKVPAKKTVSAKESAPKAQAAKENDFVVVVSKKNKRKKKSKQPAPEKAKKAPGVVATATKKAKAVEREKARAPARAFVVSTGDAGAEAAKRELWADLVKGVAAPNSGTSPGSPVAPWWSNRLTRRRTRRSRRWRPAERRSQRKRQGGRPSSSTTWIGTSVARYSQFRSSSRTRV